jgi:hypothetical protein
MKQTYSLVSVVVRNARADVVQDVSASNLVGEEVVDVAVLSGKGAPNKVPLSISVMRQIFASVL